MIRKLIVENISNTNSDLEDLKKAINVSYRDIKGDDYSIDKFWDFSSAIIMISNYIDQYWLISSRQDEIRKKIKSLTESQFGFLKIQMNNFYDKFKKMIDIENTMKLEINNVKKIINK